MKVGNGRGDQRGVDAYDKPQLTRLGSFRELTRCGSPLDILLGRASSDDCVFRGSSRFTYHR